MTTTNALRLGTLFLAKANTWKHKDGTAQIRVHVALTTPDEDGKFWAVRGTTQPHPAATSLKVQPNAISKLLKTTWFSALPDAVVQLDINEVRRITGNITAQEFNALWDKVEAQA